MARYREPKTIKKRSYRTVVADPAWPYRDRNTGGSHKSGSANKYGTMSIGEICAMRPFIDKITAPEGVLFLWIPVPLLIPDAQSVIEAWGYEYKSELPWLKAYNGDRHGMGRYFRVDTECVLLATKGKMYDRWVQQHVENYFFGDVGEHSVKPDEFFDHIEPAIKNLKPWVELFPGRKRKGWDA